MPYSHAVKMAANALFNGGVIAYPTEGVFGLGCDPFNRGAVNRILSIKGRPVEKGVILIASHFAQLSPYLKPLSEEQINTVSATWPGPCTWVIPHNGSLPVWVTGGRDNVAVRVTGHPVAAALCAEFNGPIVSTSANRSGRPAIETKFKVKQLLGQDIDYLVPGRVQTPGRASQITDLLTNAQYR